ncbi:NAD(P)H-dependent oxidoreductase [Lentilactobacillus sp. IMAU92037]|uniref:flavodoxin family protein n=1 Tax=Lentilactobacillus TaxID=2767893 RepID=UPI001C257FA2|nr:MULTISPECIES: NAD(P)H-dependent oxidoreductase [Lentilactobacillus]MBU9789687.1 NAD(P)H-dependent oxidoreductase [Lentilactobacillus dabitei]MBV0931472.1 NAD(P)H-dependent oxidoreductase [Lentilactobacillus dabitei]MDM7516621.1 NAD(P)H-dependent oxidoreductase [Lentilactobacillus sp. TOM.63]
MILFINASAEANGDTETLAKTLIDGQKYETINLADLKIAQYGQQNDHDDFAKVCDQMASVDTLVFGTPIYWSDMTGYMKTFIDRMTEVRSEDNPFAGKDMYLVITGTAPEDAIDHIKHVWDHVAQRFDMQFKGTVANMQQAETMSVSQ